MPKMSLLWSPSAEIACDSLMMVSRMSGALAAQVVGGGVDERAQRADTARLGGLQYLSQLLAAAARKSSHSTGTAVRSCGMTASFGHRRPTGVGGCQLDGPRRHQ